MVWVPDSFAFFVKEWNFDFLALEMLASDWSRSPG